VPYKVPYGLIMAQDQKASDERSARYYARKSGNTDALAELETARLERYIRRVVDAAPPLTEAQRRRLALLFDVPDAGEVDGTSMPGAA
jgi:hypothetical protein